MRWHPGATLRTCCKCCFWKLLKVINNSIHSFLDTLRLRHFEKTQATNRKHVHYFNGNTAYNIYISKNLAWIWQAQQKSTIFGGYDTVTKHYRVRISLRNSRSWGIYFQAKCHESNIIPQQKPKIIETRKQTVK